MKHLPFFSFLFLTISQLASSYAEENTCFSPSLFSSSTLALEEKNVLCKVFKNIPFADLTKKLLSTKEIHIEGVEDPYNASMIEYGDGYLMIFRFDQPHPTEMTPFRNTYPASNSDAPFRTFLGAVRLNKNFDQISSIKIIDTGSDCSEDPRVFRAGNDIYLSYNDLEDHSTYIRGIRLARLHPDTLDPYFVTNVNQQITQVDQTRHMEKNWTPFAREENGEMKVYFGYSINPHKILKMKSPQRAEMDHPIYPANITFQKLPWDEKKWGTLRGGTPAILVDGQYLAFFHTLFWQKPMAWYAMGAYTFEADPPHRVTAVSAVPILFKNCYRSFLDPNKRVLFPAGLVLGKDEDKDVLHVSCGMGDKRISVLTFDKEALLKSLAPVPLFTPSED